MENLNLNFSQIINLFVEADLKIKNLEGANKFLEDEVKQLRQELRMFHVKHQMQFLNPMRQKN
jgi:hypothetical protein